MGLGFSIPRRIAAPLIPEQSTIVRNTLRAEYEVHKLQVCSYHRIADVDRLRTVKAMGMAPFVRGRPPPMHRLLGEPVRVLPHVSHYIVLHSHTRSALMIDALVALA